MKTSSLCVGVMAALSLFAAAVQAAPMLYNWQDGTAERQFANWTSVDGVDGVGAGTATPNAAGSLGAGALTITPGALGTGIVQDDIYTTNLGLLGGATPADMTSYGASGTEIAGMRFDFYAGANGDGTGAPDGLWFYFQTTDSERWYYEIGTGYIGDGWNTYDVSFDWGTDRYGSLNWFGIDGVGDPIIGAAGFDAAITDIAGLGISIQYLENNSTQVYGVDNFGLTVPEPETYMVLGMALLTVAFVFRKRITESLDEARAMMQM